MELLDGGLYVSEMIENLLCNRYWAIYMLTKKLVRSYRSD